MHMPTREQLLQSYAARFVHTADSAEEVEAQFDEYLELNALSSSWQDGKWTVHLRGPGRGTLPAPKRRQ